MSLSVTVKGMDEVKEKIRKLLPTALKAGAEGFHEWGMLVIKDAQDQTPVRYGDLRASAHVDDPVIEDDRVTLRLGFSQNYALYVHENLYAFHKVGNAKFLENAVNADAPEALPMILRKLEEYVGGLR